MEQTKAYIELCEDPENTRLPTREGLALFLNISRDTVREWSKEHPEFSAVYDELMAKQGDQLIQNALTNKYNSSITKLLLTKHDYVERQDVTTNGKDLPQPIMNVQRDNSDAEDKASTQED